MEPTKPYGAGKSNSSTAMRAELAICTVEDSFAQTGTYIIRLPNGPLVSAGDCTHSTASPLGARPILQYPPKARVLCVYFPDVDQAIIIGACPKALSDPRLILPDSIVLRSTVGIAQDPMHYGVFTDPRTSLPNQSAGRPADTLPGDWGAINDYGVAVFIGKMMACLRASDCAKVEAFWGDDLLRIFGYNLEILTAGAEETKKNDEGEYNEVLRLSPYPWEALGVKTISDATTNADGKLEPNSEEAKFEPLEQDQLIIARYVRFRGYLGDLVKEFICAPDQRGGTETYNAESINPGLLEITNNIDGAHLIRSAKEVLLEKYVTIPTPKEMIAPEDPTGDNLTNYKPSDQLGQGEAYELPEFIWGDDQDANIRPSQLFDYHAWLFNRYTNAGLVAHKKDWFYPNESDITQPADSNVYDKNLAVGHQFLCDLPTFGTLVIDNRPGHTVRYYKSRSCIHMMDDGSVLIEDGYGSQIQMKGGSIFMTAVNDIWTMPGRSAVTYAPYDFIARAGNSADISAAKHDVRLKAERNVQILGGNEKVGGVLIESRAEGLEQSTDFAEIGQGVNGHGVTIKTAKSSFNVFAKEVYLGRGQSSPGQVVIDGGNDGNIYMRGKQLISRFNDLVSVMVSEPNSPDREVLAISKRSVLISTPVTVGGSLSLVPTQGNARANLLVGGAAVIHGAMAVGKGVATNGGFAARQGTPFVGKLDKNIDLGPSPDELGARVDAQVEALGVAVDAEEELVTENETTSPGNDTFQLRVGFSMRPTVKDLKLQEDNFVIYASRWQQMLAANGGGTTWDEPLVEAPTGEQTLPHPGFDGWLAWNAFARVALKNFNISSGKAINRDGMSEEGSAPTKTSLQAGYLINTQD